MSREALCRFVLLILATSRVATLAAGVAAAEPAPFELLPSPHAILGIRLDAPPPIDAVRPCMPPPLDRDPKIRRLVDSGDYTNARRTVNERLQRVAESSARRLAVAEVILSARADATTPREAQRRIAESLEQSDEPAQVACLRMELARLDLRAGRASQAAARALRALRSVGEEDPGPELRRAVDLYRVEALLATGAIERAREAFTRLAEGDSPESRAAALRLAALQYRDAPGSAARKRVEAKLAEIGERASRSEDWAPQLAEWALTNGDFEAVLAWLDRIPSDRAPEPAAAEAVRRADALYLLERAEEGEETLRRLANEGRSETIRHLAVVRLIDLERPPGDKAIRQLRRAASSTRRGLSLYARRVLAEQLQVAGDTTGALDIAVGLVFEAPSEAIVPDLPTLVDDLLTATAKERSCAGLLAELGGRRTLLMRHATRAEPFLRLGDCYLEYGMARAAHDTFRGVIKSFGPNATRQVTLRLARAELETGQLTRARAAAETSLRRITVPMNEWRLLFGEIMLEQDDPEALARVLAPVVRDLLKSQLDGEEARRAIWLLARAAVSYEAPHTVHSLLSETLLGQEQALREHPLLAEAALLAAEAHRRAGRDAEARLLYGLALHTLPSGPSRSRSGYWHGTLTRDIDAARKSWAEVSNADDPWGRLARTELGQSERRAEVGRPEHAPRPAQNTSIARSEP